MKIMCICISLHLTITIVLIIYFFLISDTRFRIGIENVGFSFFSPIQIIYKLSNFIQLLYIAIIVYKI